MTVGFPGGLKDEQQLQKEETWISVSDRRVNRMCYYWLYWLFRVALSKIIECEYFRILSERDLKDLNSKIYVPHVQNLSSNLLELQ